MVLLTAQTPVALWERRLCRKKNFKKRKQNKRKTTKRIQKGSGFGEKPLGGSALLLLSAQLLWLCGHLAPSLPVLSQTGAANAQQQLSP